MDKIFNIPSIVGGVVGGIISFLFGGFDVLLITFIIMMCLDYATGIIKGIYTKTLSSELGKKGILKKFLMCIVVSAAMLLQRIAGIPLREITIVFFICNEGISLLENAAEFIPIPDKIKVVLLQLRGTKEPKKNTTDDIDKDEGDEYE